MSFENLKKNRASMFEKALKDTQKLEKTGAFDKDPDDWYPGTDKAGNGKAIIRFLPPVSDDVDEVSMVSWWSHEFKDPSTSKWYIENCLYTNNNSPDPVMEYNSKLWNAVPSGLDDVEVKKHPNRQAALRQMRKSNYRANIYIVKDFVNPENNGTVKKFKFGKWCYEKIALAMKPKFLGENETPLDPFDLWEGTNFEINIVSSKKDGKLQRGYDTSVFSSNRGPLTSDKEMKKIYDQISGENALRWSLKAYVAPEKFKSYPDLLKRLNSTVGFNTQDWDGNLKTQGKVGVTPQDTNVAEARHSASERFKESKSVEKDDDQDAYLSKLKESIDDEIPF